MDNNEQKYRQQTISRTIIIGYLVILVVGNILIYAVYGEYAAVAGISCMLIGFIPLAVIYLIFYLFDSITRKYYQSKK